MRARHSQHANTQSTRSKVNANVPQKQKQRQQQRPQKIYFI